MRVQNATHLALTLLFAAGLGVSAVSTHAQSTSQKKSTASTSNSSSKNKSHKKKSAKSAKQPSRWEKGQKVPTPARISEIQQALAKDGSFTGTPNGKWDDSTVEAMRKFQDAHGLNPSGKLDAKTLQQLGLGSSTAGLGAPMPPTSSTSATVKPAVTARRQQ
jgi:peptidoglycan hydrolase-like protein with peptidoglycan-binding domain